MRENPGAKCHFSNTNLFCDRPVAGEWQMRNGTYVYMCAEHLNLVDKASLRNGAIWFPVFEPEPSSPLGRSGIRSIDGPSPGVSIV